MENAGDVVDHEATRADRRKTRQVESGFREHLLMSPTAAAGISSSAAIAGSSGRIPYST